MSATRPGVPDAAPRPSFSEAAACLGGSAAGLAAALTLGRALAGLVPPVEALPGFAALHGLDVRREIVRFLICLVFPIASGFAAQALWKSRGAAERSRHPLQAPAPADRSVGRATPRGFALAAVAAHAICTWIFAVAAFPELALRSPAMLLVVLAGCSAALAYVLGRGRVEAGGAFLAAASPVLLLAFLGPRPLPLALPAVIGAFVLPAIASALSWGRTGVETALRRLAFAGLVPVSVAALAAAAVLGTPPTADLFENGHELLPASEYLRGERPYRDIVPGHGLLSDGGIDALTLRVFGDDYRGYSRGRKVVGSAFWPSIYAVGAAATGNPAVGLGIALLSLAAFCQYSYLRVVPSLVALAFALAGSRTGARRWWTAAGAALTITFFVSVDFSVYAAAAVACALWVSLGNRKSFVLSVAKGAFAAAAPFVILLLALHIVPQFVGTTFVHIPSLLPAYALGFPPFLSDYDGGPAAGPYLAIGVALLLLGGLLPRGPALTDAARSLVPVSAWIAVSTLAVLERQHLNYPYFVVPTLVVLVARWIRQTATNRLAANLAAFGIVGGFVLLLDGFGAPRVLGTAIIAPYYPRDAAPIAEPRRARGALFHAPERVLVAFTTELIARAGFADGDTWLDFANQPGLYFLFDRPCPIRYYEVAFYESEAAQREVIAAVRGNPRVRAVLMAGTYPQIDGVANAVRAPLVAQFIREQFRPFLEKDGIQFWIRKDEVGELAAAPP